VWRGRVYDAIENVLDPFHTNFIHHGFIRRHDRRLPVQLEVNSFPRGIEMVIRQAKPDLGAMSFVLERDRRQSRTRYYPPTIVQARWEGEKKLTLCVTAFFTPVDDSSFRPFACFTTPSGLAPSWLKEAAIRLFLAPVVAQDRKALARQHAVMKQFGGPRYLEGPGDILGNRVQRLYAGETLAEQQDPARPARL
jgi:phenylpropionate dioxygenase-like ring-hydroxylating dioxygenase large terminal subunit